MIGNPTLARLDSKLGEQARLTMPGMAHWAEPDSRKTCSDCEHWHNAAGEKENKVARRCLKYAALMGGIFGPRIPHDTHACKYFEPAKGGKE
jgi:hypothetical protein